MKYHTTLRAVALISCLSVSAVAAAAESSDASTSGSANGTNVEPSAAVQKQTDGRSVSANKRQQLEIIGGAISAGAPGVEGARGAESGREVER